MFCVWELNVSCLALDDEFFIADGCADQVHGHVVPASLFFLEMICQKAMSSRVFFVVIVDRGYERAREVEKSGGEEAMVMSEE